MNRTQLIQLRKEQLQNATANAANKLKEVAERVSKSFDTSNYTSTIIALNKTIAQQSLDIENMNVTVESLQQENTQLQTGIQSAENTLRVVNTQSEICYAFANAYTMLEKHVGLTAITLSSINAVYVMNHDWSTSISLLNTIEKSTALQSRESYQNTLNSFIIAEGSQFFNPVFLDIESEEVGSNEEAGLSDATKNNIKELCSTLLSPGSDKDFASIARSQEFQSIKADLSVSCSVVGASAAYSSAALNLVPVYCHALYIAEEGAFVAELDELLLG
jgi:hypothetical protein